MSSIPNTIKQYSAFSACFLVLQHIADGQAIYTDVDPDIIIDGDGEYAGIDMDNNGTIEFAFVNRTGSFSTYPSYYLSYYEVINVGPQLPSNEIAGQIHIISPSYGGFWIYLPFALEESEVIYSDLQFYNEGYQVMAYRYTTVNGFYFPYGGFWYPEVVDHYLGVRFVDTSDCLHYGWIRCDVVENGRKLIIKDYAYETKCDTGIPAGDMIGDTSVSVNEINQLNGAIYAFNSIVYITLNELPSNCSARITDMTGVVVYEGSLMSNLNVISLLNNPKGVYLVETYSNMYQLAIKKVFID